MAEVEAGAVSLPVAYTSEGGSPAPFVRHSLIYVLARGVPGLINFAVPAVYTRLVSPATFGLYAVTLAWVALGNAVLFTWLRLSLLRFLPARQGEHERREFLSIVLLGFTVACVTALAVAAIAATLADNGPVRMLVLLGFIFLVVHAGFELNLELLRTQLNPAKYGLLYTMRAALSLILGAALVGLGYGAAGMIVGTILGIVLASIATMLKEWRGVKLRIADRVGLQQCVGYGMPLTLALAFSYIVSSSDRLLLSILAGPSQAGLYAAGYDIAQAAVVGALLPIGLASFPLAVRAMDQFGPTAAAREMSRNFVLLLAIGLPAAAGMGVLATNVAHTLLAPEFRGAATKIIPWIAFAGLGIAAIEFHFNRVFQLSRQTWRQLLPYGIAAVVNLGMNACLIPGRGLMGAVYATVIAYGVAVALAWKLTSTVLPVSLPVGACVRVVVATGAMVTALLLVKERTGLTALFGQVAVGAAVYGLCLGALCGSARPAIIMERLAGHGRAVA